MPPSRTILVAIALTFPASAPAEHPVPPARLVVHEWGVLTVGHPGGTPVLGSADRYLDALPKFVIRNDLQAAAQMNPNQQTLTVWKPVIHLYGDEGEKVEVTVSVAGGYPIVFFPNPKLAGYTSNNGRDPITSFQSMTWNFSLTKKRPTSLLTPPTDHWWNAARNVPGDYVVMDDGSGSERFLFYEGSTGEQPSVSAAVSKEFIAITNTDSAISAPVLLIRNDNGSRSGAYVNPVAPGQVATLSPDSFVPWDEETLFAHCRKQWEACGMTAEEAVGIVESWKAELLNTAGFLLISRIPEPVYARMFPIEIKPAPADLARACLVFDTLAGQPDRNHWLPRLTKAGREAFADLTHHEFKQRLQAEAKIIGFGEIMSPLAEEILSRENLDPQLKLATTTLMGVLTESPVCNHQLPPTHYYPSARGPIYHPSARGPFGGGLPLRDLAVPVPDFELVPEIDG